MLDDTTHKKKDEDKQNKKTQHNMCWTTPYTRQKTKTNKTKNTTQYVLDNTIHKTKDEDKQNKTKTQYVLDDTIQKTKDEDKRTKKHNTICVGHHHTQDQRRRQAKQKTQHNMCWTSPHTREKIKTNKTKNHNTICVGHHHTQEKR